MNKWMVAGFRLILLCSTIIVAFLLAQGALYSHEIFQEWMINNKKIYIIDGLAETLSGKKSRDKANLDYGLDDNEKSGKLWIEESAEKKGGGPHIPYLKEGMASNSIIIYSCITIIILLIVWRIYKSRRNKKQLQQGTIDEGKIPPQSTPSPSAKIKTDWLPNNPIRAELVTWERQLPLSKQRRSYETIQQWFTRIGCSNEIVGLYEKTRYGDFAFTSDDKQFIHEWIKKHI
ncbi:hypothetical protein COE51_13925 [Bacillus pseudomycoides]|nr:hypothetical protein COE51_13925 [Bacillus pseudomycoides]